MNQDPTDGWSATSTSFDFQKETGTVYMNSIKDEPGRWANEEFTDLFEQTKLPLQKMFQPPDHRDQINRQKDQITQEKLFGTVHDTLTKTRLSDIMSTIPDFPADHKPNFFSWPINTKGSCESSGPSTIPEPARKDNRDYPNHIDFLEELDLNEEQHDDSLYFGSVDKNIKKMNEHQETEIAMETTMMMDEFKLSSSTSQFATPQVPLSQKAHFSNGNADLSHSLLELKTPRVPRSQRENKDTPKLLHQTQRIDSMTKKEFEQLDLIEDFHDNDEKVMPSQIQTASPKEAKSSTVLVSQMGKPPKSRDSISLLQENVPEKGRMKTPTKVIRIPKSPVSSTRQAIYSCDFSHQQLVSLHNCFTSKHTITRLKLY